MIERKFVASNIKEFMIQEFVAKSIRGAEHSHTKLQRTPLGEKIIIYSARPGLIVGRKGQNIKQLTKVLKKKFKLENPQIEINEVENINLDADIMSEKIANYLEKFGTSKFKGIGHKIMSSVMEAGAMGIEILISGKIPSSRARSWRFYQGYLKKCGDIAVTGVNISHTTAKLKTGIIGIKVSIMPPNTKLSDHIELREEKEEIVEEVTEKEGEKEEKKEKKKPVKKKKKAKKKEDKETKENKE
jgi:small subunit ribosomal protein S3